MTTLLGDALRYFANETCKHFKTFETDKEYQARTRATARRVAKESALEGSSTPALSALGTSSSTPGPSSTLGVSSTSGPPDALGASSTPAPSAFGASIDVPLVQAVLPSTSAPQSGNSGKRPKFFNVATPKTHFFPDYVGQIEAFGTTDNLSTKLVSNFN
jgi:hypothetical protein